MRTIAVLIISHLGYGSVGTVQSHVVTPSPAECQKKMVGVVKEARAKHQKVTVECVETPTYNFDLKQEYWYDLAQHGSLISSDPTKFVGRVVKKSF